MGHSAAATPLDPFEIRLAQAWPSDEWSQTHVLVAVSAGPDSVALLRCLLALQPDHSRIAVAHFNHRLRGDDALADQQFVQQLCRSWNVDCAVGSAEPAAITTARTNIGLESAARQLRYRFLIEAAEQQGARYLVTGHSADDQAETVLHHVLRGTGLAGLAGMAAVRPVSPAVTLVRPLLAFSREDIRHYLQRIDQPFRSDASNDDTQFTRNRLRCDLLPRIEQQYNPSVRQALLRLSRIAAEAQQSLAACLQPLLDQHVRTRHTPAEVRVEIDGDRELARLTPHLQRELFVAIWRQHGWPLRHVTFRHWQHLAALLQPASNPPPLELPAGIRASRDGRQVVLIRRTQGRPTGDRDGS